MSQLDPVRRLVVRLTAVTVAVLVVLSVAASWAALNSFERVLFPELRLKAQAVAEDVLKREIERALEFDIPLDQLPGLDEEVAQETAKHPDLAYATIEDASGRRLTTYGNVIQNANRDLEIVVPLKRRGETVANLRMGIDPGHAKKASLDLMLEIGSEMLVSVLITFEILLLVVHLSLAKVNAMRRSVILAESGDFRGVIPLAGGALQSVSKSCREALEAMNRRLRTLSAEARQALGGRFKFLAEGENAPSPGVNLIYLRLPVFLFCLSEELTRPFMPAFAQSLAPTAPWLGTSLTVSLPITLFMLIWAMSQPLGARLSGHIGRRQAFGIAAALAAIGLVMTAVTDHLVALLAWRCVTALGYGVALITAQGLVVDNTGNDNRASGLALYIGALLAAGVCGPVIGGIVAEQVGARANFLIGAIAALAAATILFRLFRDTRPPVVGQTATGDEGHPVSAAALATNPRFVALMALSAIPAKIAGAGVLYCLIPLLMASSGSSTAEIGRVQMVYFVFFILASPMAANLSDRWQARRGFIIAGGVGTLLSFAPIFFFVSELGAPLAIALFGATQALIGAPQLTLVTQIAARAGVKELVAIGWYRLLERLGGAAGPLLVIAFASIWSYHQAMLAIGILCGASAILLWWLYRRESFAGPQASEISA